MNADQYGFLVPDHRLPADEATPTLKAIKRDTATVIRLLKGQVRSNVLQRARPANPNAGGQRAASASARNTASVPVGTRSAAGGVDRARDSRGRFIASAQRAGDPVERAVRQLTRQQAQQAAAEQRAETSRANRERSAQAAGSAQVRDARGRFGAGGGTESGSARSDKDGLLARLKTAVSGHGGSGGDLEKIDPAIEAANELRNLAGGPLKAVGEVGKAVIGRGVKHDKSSDALPWYRRILSQLKIMRKEDREFDRAELRAIGGIHAGGGGDGGMLGIIKDVAQFIFSPMGAAIVTAIAAGWALVGDKVKELAGKLVDMVADKLGIVRKAGEAANDFIKEKTGIDVAGGAQKLADRASAGLAAAKERTGAGLTAAKDWAAGAVAPIGRLLSAKGTARVYERADGSTEMRDGGTVSWRNNNPGNLKFGYAGSADKTVNTKRSKADALAAAKKAYGNEVVDLDQWGNAIFSSESAGRAAQAQLLTSKHGNKTIEEMLPKYAISDYSGKANVQAYASSIYKSADAKGIDLRGKKIGDMSSQELGVLLDGMRKVEGYKVGVTRVSDAVPSIPSVTAAPGMPSAKSVPSIPQSATATAPLPPQAPRVDIPVQLNSKPAQPVVVANDSLANQDVKDRRLAHIATGGMAGH
jgi:hypothetical protein